VDFIILLALNLSTNVNLLVSPTSRALLLTGMAGPGITTGWLEHSVEFLQQSASGLLRDMELLTMNWADLVWVSRTYA